ncbi:MAG: AAA family ATPase, partial [Duodenibacillus sp.]
IGKSTTSANVALALAESGKKVMLIGCDPKADSTSLLRAGKPVQTVLELLRTRHKSQLGLEEMVTEGTGGVLCVEAGGPKPGVGCAGRGIIAALEALKTHNAFEVYKPDVVIFDVLGDVVCGGFAMPIRDGWAKNIFIVTSGENMALHAAANIAVAVETFAERGYARLGGLIVNRRDVPRELEKVQELAGDVHTSVVGILPRSEEVLRADEAGVTVIEAFPEGTMAAEYRKLAAALLAACSAPEHREPSP